MLAVAVVIAAAASLLFDLEVDVPEWANVPGVDLPFVGDDPLRCDVVAAPAGVVVELAGSPDTIDDYRHVWVNGEIDGDLVVGERRVEVEFADEGELHLAVSRTRRWDDRFWCGSASNVDGILER